jgi:hypothetical protein
MLFARLRVRSRTSALKRSSAFGAMRRFGVEFAVKLKPRNLRVHGRATALFSSFTVSLSGPSAVEGPGAAPAE